LGALKTRSAAILEGVFREGVFRDWSTGGLEAWRLRLDCDVGREALVEFVDCKRRLARSMPRGVGGYTPHQPTQTNKLAQCDPN